jgi:hypothetical protein
MTELDRLVDYLKEKNLNEKTIDKHRNNYKIIKENITRDVKDIPQKEWKKLLDGNMKKSKSEEIITNPNTLHNLTTTILYILTIYDKPRDKLVLYSQRLKVIKETHKRNQTEKVGDLGITAKYLRDRLNQLFKDEKYLEYVINYLIINLNVRNEDLDVVITDKDEGEEDENYLVVKKNSVMYIRRRYKTERFHGEKIFLIRNKQFITALNNLGGFRPPTTGVRVSRYLLALQDGSRMNKSSIANRIKSYSIDNLGTTKISKIITSEATNSDDKDKLDKISRNRGTHLATLLDAYSYYEKND